MAWPSLNPETLRYFIITVIIWIFAFYIIMNSMAKKTYSIPSTSLFLWVVLCPSQGNVLTLTSKVCGFKPGRDQLNFFRTQKSWTQVLLKGLSAGGLESEISGSLKNLKPEKNRPLSKIYSPYSRHSNT